MARSPHIRFITIYPNLIEHYLKFGVFNKAGSILSYEVINLRDFADDKHGSVDDKPYGGIDGMVLRADVLAAAVNIHPHDYIVSSSPRSETYFNQHEAHHLLNTFQDKDIAFICGRFSGIDERFERRYIKKSYSFGDFVVSGGELPCLMMAEAMIRLYPGVLGNKNSWHHDSFAVSQETGYVEHPLYTKPRVFEGEPVPLELISGDHKIKEKWQKSASYHRPLRLK
ncbi:MAG: tRNA (guanosine(37)-N1)-methyltransferase TrmD [Proteobacteria bacterium]|nr:tRNA (guanosine(37)-N1)-methyltransferase TrmD [Pseudomonadota bacterium]